MSLPEQEYGMMSITKPQTAAMSSTGQSNREKSLLEHEGKEVSSLGQTGRPPLKKKKILRRHILHGANPFFLSLQFPHKTVVFQQILLAPEKICCSHCWVQLNKDYEKTPMNRKQSKQKLVMHDKNIAWAKSCTTTKDKSQAQDYATMMLLCLSCVSK